MMTARPASGDAGNPLINLRIVGGNGLSGSVVFNARDLPKWSRLSRDEPPGDDAQHNAEGGATHWADAICHQPGRTMSAAEPPDAP